jgi:hypothetical protein
MNDELIWTAVTAIPEEFHFRTSRCLSQTILGERQCSVLTRLHAILKCESQIGEECSGCESTIAPKLSLTIDAWAGYRVV